MAAGRRWCCWTSRDSPDGNAHGSAEAEVADRGVARLRTVPVVGLSSAAVAAAAARSLILR